MPIDRPTTKPFSIACEQAPAAKGLHAVARPALRASRNATRQVTRAEGKLNVADLTKEDLEGKRVRPLTLFSGGTALRL